MRGPWNRPLAFVVNGAEVSLDAVRGHLQSRGWARWQLPNRVEVIDQIPVTSVGKFDKKALRARLEAPNAKSEATAGRHPENRNADTPQ